MDISCGLVFDIYGFGTQKERNPNKSPFAVNDLGLYCLDDQASVRHFGWRSLLRPRIPGS